MTDIISPSYTFINLSSVKLCPLGSAPFKVSALTGRFISLEICTNQMSLVATCQNVSLARQHERLSGERQTRGRLWRTPACSVEAWKGLQPLILGGFTLLNISSCTGGMGFRIQVSETSSLTIPKRRWLQLLVPGVKFPRLFCSVGGRSRRGGEGRVVLGLCRGAEQPTNLIWFPSDAGWL